MVVVIGFLPQTQFHDLRGFTPVSIDGDALQPEFPGPQIGLGHIPDHRFMGQIDCFGNRIVHMPLKCSLDLKMPLRGDFQGRHEESFEILRNASYFLEPALFKDFFNDPPCFKTMSIQILDKEGIYFEKGLPVENVGSFIGECK
jgi:hypothetical protein